MPEMLTKYPDIALQILKEAKIKCGMGEKQKILTSCPKDRFCSLPTGELCVYGVQDISQMTQLNPEDLFLVSNTTLMFIAFAFLIFIFGMMLGIKITKK